MQKNSIILTQFGFASGFGIATVLCAIFNLNYFHLEKHNNQSLQILEGMAILVTSVLYIKHLIFDVPEKTFRVTCLQSIILTILFFTTIIETYPFARIIHISCYVVSCITWVSHLIWIKTLPTRNEKNMLKDYVGI